MPRVAASCLVWLALAAAAPAAAQTAAPNPPGPYVVDVRFATIAIPSAAGFFPPVPTATIIPSRGFGVDLGAHVYLIRLGAARLGIGANLWRARGTSSNETPASGSTSTPAPQTKPDVDATLTTIAPQLSFNFGSAEGWSYVSAGLGRAQLTTNTSAFAGSETTMTPARSVDSGTRSSINIGGGARWFTNRHLAFSFDVRFHKIAAGSGEAATPATTLVAASAGLSLR